MPALSTGSGISSTPSINWISRWWSAGLHGAKPTPQLPMIAVVALPSPLLIALMMLAGFLGGVIAPSRDMLVRNAAPPGAAGRAFGIVSTGFNFSGILAPLLYGFIMDQQMPHWVFGASVAFMLMTVLLALVTDRKSQRPAEPVAVH